MMMGIFDGDESAARYYNRVLCLSTVLLMTTTRSDYSHSTSAVGYRVTIEDDDGAPTFYKKNRGGGCCLWGESHN